MTTFTTLAFGMPGWQELLILGVIGLLIFGKRLPEVGRSIGKGIVEFKKGLAGIDEEVDAAVEKQKQLEAEAGNTTNVETSTESHAETSTKAEPSA
ncbi:MAG: twin-arginine translocase TatA/TatE family subunit [Planctomycetota bacterium]